MDSEAIKNIFKKQTLTKEDVDLFIEHFNKNHTPEQFDNYKNFYYLANGIVDESQILRINNIIESFMLEDITINQKAFLLNNQTCFFLFINNKYGALDSAYKFLDLKCESKDEIFLNSNYFFNMYYDEGLYSEAIRVYIDLINKPYFNEYIVFIKFVVYGNLFLAYAKLKDYKNYMYYMNLSKKCIEELNSDTYTLYFEVSRLSSEAILYSANQNEIAFNELIEKYKNILKEYNNRTTNIFDSVDIHLEIIYEMINQKMYKDAEEICEFLLKKTNSSRYNFNIYKCLKKLYEITNSDKYNSLLKKYLECVEELDSKEKEFYRSYLVRFAKLYQISSNYYELLNEYEHDPLTNCYSRGALDNLIEKNTHIDGSLLFFDLNDFKIINDTYGHTNGDEYLKIFAQSLISIFSPISECYRIGGDEFVVFSTYDR